MRNREIQDYIHEHIPLSRAMGVRVLSVDRDAAVLEAPLGPNINHRETAFGGSASALAILAAWCLVYARLEDEGMGGRIVIRRNSMTYTRPIPGPFRARSAAPDPAQWRRVAAALDRGRMTRVTVGAVLEAEGEVVGEFEGEFVILPRPVA